MEIKSARQALGLTQAQLAEKLGVDHSLVSRLERGEVIPSTRDKLAVEALLVRAGLAA